MSYTIKTNTKIITMRRHSYSCALLYEKRVAKIDAQKTQVVNVYLSEKSRFNSSVAIVILVRKNYRQRFFCNMAAVNGQIATITAPQNSRTTAQNKNIFL